MKFSLDFLNKFRTLRANPSRDWLALLAFFTVLLIASIVWNVVFFASVERGTGGINAGSAAAAPSTPNIGTVENVFSARAAEEAKYTNSAYTFVDPSKE